MIRGFRNLKWITYRRYPIRFQSTLSISNISPLTNQINDVDNRDIETSKVNRPNTKNYGYRRNEKLVEVSKQVAQTIKTASIDESIEIFTEGVFYLRSIQQDEDIKETFIYNEYERLGSELLTRILEQGDITKAQEFLEILKEHKVIHGYHFYLIMVHELKNGDGHKYERVLQYWVNYLESKSILNENVNINNIRQYLRDVKYYANNLMHLAYFAYCQGFIQGKYEYKSDDIIQLLQVDELPQLHRVKNVLNHLKIPHFAKEIHQFEAMFKSLTMKNLNPNDRLTLDMIENYTVLNDVKSLQKLYQDIKQNSRQNNINISSLTIYKILSSFYELESFQNVFNVFQDILTSGKIDQSIWELVIKSLGHTQYLVTIKEEQKPLIISNLESTINAMLSQGHSVTPKTISAIVGSFANLNQSDKVDYYLNKYNSLPVLKSTKENIIMGLCFNDNILKAEAKLKEFVTENNVPSTKLMNSFLTYHSKVNNYEAIRGIVQFMEQYKIPEDVISLTIIIDTYFKGSLDRGQLPKVDQVLELLQNSAFKVNYVTYTVVLNALIKGGNIEAARGIAEFLMLSDANKKSPQIMTSMLKGELTIGSIDKAQQLFDKYIEQFRSDARIWNLMIQELLRKDDSLAMEYYERLQQQAVNRIYPNFFTYYFLISHFKRKNNYKILQRLVNDIADLNMDDYGRELPKLIKLLDVSLPDKLRAL